MERIDRASIIAELSEREMMILRLMADGLSNQEIANQLYLALTTIKWYIRQINNKLDTHSRTQTVARAHQLRLVGGSDAARVALAEAHEQPENPYKGLHAFQEQDASDFFGRDMLVRQMLKRLSEPGAASHFLTLIGPSGSGKSSVVKAGLIPALRRGELPGSDKWLIAEIFPGARPLEELEVALLRLAVNPPTSLLPQLREDERGLLRAARRILPHSDDVLALVIDQFEEVFTLVADPNERQAFLDLLFTAATDSRSPLVIILTLRADFYDRPLLDPRFGALMCQHVEAVLPLTVDDLSRAITAPSERVGVKVEADLVTTIVSEVSQQPSVLPLLQYALTELFDACEGRTLTLGTYHALGGALAMLAHRADALYEQLDLQQRQIARQMFLRLVSLGEGTEDTRRRAFQSELLSLGDDPDSMDAILQTFAAFRLLTLDRDPATRTATVELAHEAIIREWKRLGSWLDESRADVRQQRLLAASVAEWLKVGRDSGFLLSGSRLTQFEEWEKTTGLALTGDERAFLAASLAERERQEKREHERQAREKRLERRLQTFLRALVVVLLLATLGALGLTALAIRNANEAEDARAISDANFRRAEAQRLAGEANQLLLQSGNSEQIALLSIRSMNTQYSPQGDAALAGASLLAYPQRIFVVDGGGIAWDGSIVFSPDGSHFAIPETAPGCASTDCKVDGVASLWDVQSGQRIREYPTGVVHQVAFSPDGQYLATAGADKIARLWDVGSGQEIRQFTGHTAPLSGVTFSTDGKYLLTTSADGNGANHVGGDNTARLWDVETGQEIRQFIGHINWVIRGAFAPDSKTIATISADHTARLWDVQTGQEIRQFIGHSDWLWGDTSFSPDGKYFLTASFDRTARLWDVETGEEVRRFVGHTDNLESATFSPDGKYVLTASYDQTARIWDTQTGLELRRFVGHTDGLVAAAFSPDGNSILTGSNDKTVRLWDIRTNQQFPQFVGSTDGILKVAFSPDGQYVLTGSRTSDHTPRLWDAQTGQEVHRFEGYTDQVHTVTFSPDGSHILTTGGTNPTRLWDSQTYQLVHEFESPYIQNIAAYSPDGAAVLTGSDDGSLHVWDARTGMLLYELMAHAASFQDAVYSSDGRYIASASSDMTTRLWTAETGELALTLPISYTVYSVSFSPDSRYLATGGFDGSVRIWDIQSAQSTRSFIGHNAAVWGIAFSPDGRYLLTGSLDKTARLWDTQTGQELRRYSGHTGGVVGVAFSPDGRFVLTGSSDRTARLWDVDYRTTIDYLCSRLQRDFFADERVQYGITDSTPTCL